MLQRPGLETKLPCSPIKHLNTSAQAPPRCCCTISWPLKKYWYFLIFCENVKSGQEIELGFIIIHMTWRLFECEEKDWLTIRESSHQNMDNLCIHSVCQSTRLQPDRPFHNLWVDRRTLFSSETLIHKFWGPKIVKWSVGRSVKKTFSRPFSVIRQLTRLDSVGRAD